MKKLVTILAIVSLLVGQVSYVPLSVVLAAPELPGAPDKPDAPELPDQPNNQQDENNNEDEEAQSTEEANTNEEQVVDEVVQQEESVNEEGSNTEENKEDKDDVNENHVKEDGNTGGGDIDIETGDATATGTISNTGNSNVASDEPVIDEGNDIGVSIKNEGNGEDSENTGSVIISDNSETDQANDADLDNDLEVNADSGNNSASKNAGGDKSITTGDAAATGTILNMVNTNVDALVVSEFNVYDDHVGDLILDYEEGCIAGCDIFNASVENTGNGAGSTNTGEIVYEESDITNQLNNADIENNLILNANSGYNMANDNTNGDVMIETGDAIASANVINVTNTNIAGGLIYGVVNIFGDLTGNIIIPADYLASLGINASVSNSGNGAGSTNTGGLTLASYDDFNQINDAEIINNLDLSATTGDNSISDNTGGDSSIKTGDSKVDAQITNIANNNIIGEDLFFVLINNAGTWFGQILGIDGANYGLFALGSGFGSQVGDNGEINIANNGNLEDSTNTGTVEITDTNEINQENNAKIVNNLILDANTGGNEANRNSGGDKSIKTGDASVFVNLLNLANNNIIGGNVVVTVVNVFGNWIGNIFDSNYVPEAVAESSDSGIGGQSFDNNSNNSNNSDNSSNQSSNSSGGSSNNSTQAVLGSTISLITNGQNVYYSSDTSETTEEENSVNDEKLALGGIGNNIDTQDSNGLRINLAYLIPIFGIAAVGFLIKRRLFS